MDQRKKITPSQFRAAASGAIGKLGRNDTAKTGEAELKELFNKITEEQVQIIFSLLQETNEHLTLAHRREILKVYGLMAEVTEENFVPYIQKSVNVLNKKLKEGDAHIHESISTSFGLIAHNTLHTIPDVEASCKELAAMLKPLFNNFQSQTKSIQVGSALCLTKIIQHSPIECLKFILPRLCPRIIESLQLTNIKCQTQLLESLVGLILSVESDFSPYAVTVLPVILQSITNED